MQIILLEHYIITITAIVLNLFNKWSQWCTSNEHLTSFKKIYFQKNQIIIYTFKIKIKIKIFQKYSLNNYSLSIVYIKYNYI